MALINLTDAELNALSDKYDARKRKFEKDLMRDLGIFFGAMSDELYLSIIQTESQFSFFSYLNDIESLLLKHYRIAGFDFAQNLKRLINNQDESSEQLDAVKEVRKDFNEAILLALLGSFRSMAKRQAQIIMNTTERIYSESRDKVFGQMISQGVIYDKRKTAQEIVALVDERNANRIKTIAETEIASSTGEAVQTEMATVAGVIYGLPEFDPRKIWKTVGDGNVRDAHARANNQKRKYDELYLVGGERLMYPADSSHGASIWNTINCRCNSIKVI